MNLAIILAFRALQQDVLAFREATSARNSAFVILDATIDFLDVIANRTVGLKHVPAMLRSENAIQIFAFLANHGCQ